MRKGFLLIVVLVLATGYLQAQSIPIANPSFEEPALADGGYNFVIPNWTITGGVAGVWNPSVAQSSAAFVAGIPDGDQVGYSNAGDLEQSTGVTLQPGYRYVLKVSIGGRPGAYSGRDYALILAGDTPLNTTTGTNVANEWFEQTVIYNSPIDDSREGEEIKVQLVNNEGGQLNFDQVTLDAMTCEGFLPPFDKPLTLKKKENRAIPVKMVLRDLLGNDITDADLSAPPVVQVSVGGDSGSAIDGYNGDLLPAGLSDDGNEFRYDWATEQWIINLATKQYTSALLYNVTVFVDGNVIKGGCSQTFTRQ